MMGQLLSNVVTLTTALAPTPATSAVVASPTPSSALWAQMQAMMVVQTPQGTPEAGLAAATAASQSKGFKLQWWRHNAQW